MTNFHQGSPHYEPVWIDQTPGQRNNALPGPWPDESVSVPVGNQPSPVPPPPPVGTVPVFDVSAADDAAIRSEIKTPYKNAMQRWNRLIGYTRDQQRTLAATWTGGTPWTGSTLWPREINANFDGNVITFTKVHYFAGGTGAGSTIAFAARVLPRQGQNRNQLSQGYILGVNTDQIGQLTASEWEDVFAHELAHSLGMQAACWFDNVDTSNSTLDGGAYPTGRDNYRTLTSSQASSILLDTADNSHWEDQTRDGIQGFTNELLIATAQPNMIISSLTLGVARDQGYQVIGQPEGTPTLTNLRDTSPVSQHSHPLVTIIHDDYYQQIL